MKCWPVWEIGRWAEHVGAAQGKEDTRASVLREPLTSGPGVSAGGGRGGVCDMRGCDWALRRLTGGPALSAALACKVGRAADCGLGADRARKKGNGRAGREGGSGGLLGWAGNWVLGFWFPSPISFLFSFSLST